jgi:hypothetical protein
MHCKYTPTIAAAYCSLNEQVCLVRVDHIMHVYSDEN